MAKTYCAHLCVPLHIAGEHCHRIGVIQKQSVGADLFHVSCKLFHHRNGSQRTHNAADSQGICNGLAQPVFLGNLKVCDGAGIIASHLDGIYYKIRIPQRVFSVLHAQISRDICPSLVYIFVDSIQDDLGLLQTLLINIVQSDICPAKSRCAHAVAQYVSGKHCAACSHKSNFHGFCSSFSHFFRESPQGFFPCSHYKRKSAQKHIRFVAYYCKTVALFLGESRFTLLFVHRLPCLSELHILKQRRKPCDLL